VARQAQGKTLLNQTGECGLLSAGESFGLGQQIIVEV